MRRRWILMTLAFVAAAAAVGAVAAIGLSMHVQRVGKAMIVAPAQARPAEVAIVLGALVYGDEVSMVVEDRLQAALDLYRAGTVRKLLVSGDHGTAGYDEVNAMRRWLEARGVPSRDVFMDHAGFNTYATMYRARDVFQVRDCIVVTQGYHLPRALFIASRLGLNAQGVSATARVFTAEDSWRELAARVKAYLNVALGARPLFLGNAIPITGDGRDTRG